MKKFSKILCLALSFILAFTLAVPAFAANGAQTCPVIHIPGIAGSAIYTDKDNPDEKITDLDSEVLVDIVKKTLIPSLIVFSADRDAEKLASTLCGELNSAFAGWFNNPDGSAQGNSGAYNYYPAVNATSQLTFNYDWRGDPVEIAKELADYIDYVTLKSGCDKVALTPHSLGNVITLSYLSIYGFDKVYGVVFDSPAIDGVGYIGELLCGKLEFSADSIELILRFMLGTTEYEELLTGVADAFELAGIPEMLSVFLNDIIGKLAPTLYKETLAPLFASWPTIWAMTPDEYIDDAMNHVFTNYLSGEGTDVLIGRIENYNNLVREDKHQKLLDFDSTARVSVISRYDYTSFPATSCWDSLGDGVIDTKYSSFGATTTKPGAIFDEAYLADKDAAYISPDKTIDASTCLFPEKTWFIKNLPHSKMEPTKALYNAFLFADEEAVTDSFELSRFTIYDAETEAISKDETTPSPSVELTPWQVLVNFIRSLLAKFLELFKR